MKVDFVARASVFFLSLAAVFGTTGALAQSFPDKVVRMVVPFPPGGGADGPARVVAEKMSTILGQPVIVDNKPGASANIGAEFVARAPADGYTLLFTNEVLSSNQSMFRALRYDSVKDFVPVAKIGNAAVAMAVHPGVQAKSLAELVAVSKDKEINYASPGVGTGPHLFAELLVIATGAKFNHIPYKGAGPATTDAVGGQVDMIITALAPLAPHVANGKLRALAVTGSARSGLMREIPTVAESGVTAFTYDLWYALVAPAGVPAPVLAKLQQAAATALQDRDVVQRLRTMGIEPDGSPPSALPKQISDGIERWNRVIREANISRE